MKVLIPTALYSYSGQSWVEANGATVADVLTDLDQRYPGIRFRIIDEQGSIRRHIRFFYNNQMVHTLSQTLSADGELYIVQALSGG